jgi:hypothetical protein
MVGDEVDLTVRIRVRSKSLSGQHRRESKHDSNPMSCELDCLGANVGNGLQRGVQPKWTWRQGRRSASMGVTASVPCLLCRCAVGCSVVSVHLLSPTILAMPNRPKLLVT